MNINSILVAATMKKSYRVGVFGNVVVITDHNHKTDRFYFGNNETATEAATKLVQGKGRFFTEADRKHLSRKAESNRTAVELRQKMLDAGIIAA